MFHKTHSEPQFEQLETRCTPTVVCSANPTYAADCAYLSTLIPQSAITDTAVQSGNWSDPTTWGGRVPGDGDNVWIPNGVTVTVDKQEPGSLRSILDNGLLTFATNVNTSLLVDTLVVGTDNAAGIPQGELDVGTTANPIQPGVSAVVTFADTGTLTQAWPNDPEQLARGLISMNTVSIVGSTVTPYDTMTSGMNAGSSVLTLGSVPVGWQAGDTLLFPGASEMANQDEQLTIESISGNTVTLSSPLAYSHGNTLGQPVYVADESRNVIFQSQNAADYERHGHVMFMHTDQETVQNADFLYLGRTDKAMPLGATNPDGTRNVVGRYAVHFHRDYYPGMSNNDPPVLVSGNFEMGSPGWGYDNHSSNVDMEDNVAFQNNGSGFVTEAGNEIGTFNANLAVRTTTSVANPTSYSTLVSRQNINDFGFTGSGFWMQSPSCVLTNNVALDNVAGYQFWNQALSTPGLIDPHTGFIPTWNGQDTRETPLAGFSGNSAAYSAAGLQLFNNLRDIGVNNFVPGQQSVIDHFTSYQTAVGADFDVYVSSALLQNSSLFGDGTTKSVGVATTTQFTTDVSLTNDAISGFGLGFSLPTGGNNLVQGNYLDDVTAFYMPAQRPSLNYALFAREITFAGNTFGPDIANKYVWDTADFDLYEPNVDFMPQSVWIDGVEQYFAYQSPSFVPFPTLRTSMPPSFIGLTNAQLLQQYGLVEGGFLTGQSPPFFYQLLSPSHTTTPTYTLSYQTPEGPVTESSPVTLQAGPNVLTRTVNGQLHSWLVEYQVPTYAVESYQTVNGTMGALPVTVTANGSTVQVTATATAGATSQGAAIISGAFTYAADIEGNILYISRNATIKAVVLPPAATYNISLAVNPSAHALTVSVNGITYLTVGIVG